MDLTHDIQIHTSSSLDLRPKDNRFKFEINLGLALPTKFRVEKDYDIAREFESLVKSVDEHNNIAMVKIKTQSNLGPLGAFDNDILTILLTMAWEQREYNERNIHRQNGYRVYYSHYEICRRLGLSMGSAGHVAESVDKIASQNLRLNNFAYKSDDKTAIKKDESTKIILKKGRVSVADGLSDADEYTSLFYIEFDQFVVRNLYNDYVSVLNSRKYLSLSSGPSRRIYVFLSSKRKVFGDRFTFDLFELTKVLGIYESSPRRQQEYVSKYLKKVSLEVNNFNYLIQKERGKSSWTVLIDFNEKELVEAGIDPFYSALLVYYGDKALAKLGLLEVDVLNYREEFVGKFKAISTSEQFSFQKQAINPAEFALDIALFQVLKQNYPITKSFKALAKSILISVAENSFELPEGYRYFLYKRVSDQQKKKEKALLESEKQRQLELKEEEQRKLDRAFRDFYKNVIQKNKRQMNIYKEKATELLRREEVHEEDMMYNLLLESKIESLAKEDFDKGEVMSLASRSGELFLS